jgi:hypothetical protein
MIHSLLAFNLKVFVVIFGMLISLSADARDTRCELVEHALLRKMGLAEGNACHQQYQDCLNRPNRAQDPIRKSRCMETIRCGAIFWTPTPHLANLEVFKQECELSNK